jgi:hypothetical protein
MVAAATTCCAWSGDAFGADPEGHKASTAARITATLLSADRCCLLIVPSAGPRARGAREELRVAFHVTEGGRAPMQSICYASRTSSHLASPDIDQSYGSAFGLIITLVPSPARNARLCAMLRIDVAVGSGG